jgi:hypothetical protein
MNSNITFEDILNPEKYLKLQNSFKYYDDSIGKEESYFNEPTLEEFTIFFGGLNPDTGKNEQSEESFFKDHLIPKISNLGSDYLKRYQNKLEKLKLSKGNLDLLYKQRTNEILIYFESLEASKHLIDDVSFMVQEQLDICLEKLQELNSKKESFRGDKINFREPSYDILALFYILRQNGIINWYSYPDLKILIENNCRYFDEESKTYIDFKINRRLFSGISNGSDGITKALGRLKNKFQNEDFFEMK